MRVVLNKKGQGLIYNFRFWLSDKLSALSVKAHPESEKADAVCRELSHQLMRDQIIYGTSFVRVDPKEILKGMADEN